MAFVSSSSHLEMFIQTFDGTSAITDLNTVRNVSFRWHLCCKFSYACTSAYFMVSNIQSLVIIYRTHFSSFEWWNIYRFIIHNWIISFFRDFFVQFLKHLSDNKRSRPAM